MDESLIARVIQLVLALGGAYLLALWFALVVWTYRDITARSANPFTQIFSTLVVVLFFVPGAIIYLILRPRETLDEAFQRAVEEEYLLQDLDEAPTCPACRRAVRDEFVFCPHCRAELRQSCRSCHRLVDLRWEVCPYCGSEQSDTDFAAQEGEREERRPRQAPLQAIDGGRAKRRGAREQDGERVPAWIATDDSHTDGGDPKGSTATDAPDAATTRVGVRDRSDRGQATGRRRGGSGS